MVGRLDKEVIDKFKEFQEKTGKHTELYIEDVEFEKINADKSNNYFKINNGQRLKKSDLENNKDNLIDPIEVYSATESNEEVFGYIERKKLKTISPNHRIYRGKTILLNTGGSVGAVRFKNNNFDYTVIDNVIVYTTNQDIFSIDYLYFALKAIIKSDFFSYSNTLRGKDLEKANLIVPIPKDLNKFYNSYQIQEAIVEFLEYSFERINRIRENIDTKYELFQKLKKALIPSTFIKDYVKVAFGRYAKEYDIGFNIIDVEFEIKRIHSDKKDDPNVICKKRMGFTPKTSSDGDINWFSVKDLGKVEGLYINEPNTNKKTTIELIRQAVDKKNTGKSEKLIPIKKNDILISFKLTVGVVKIYNSDKPAYCNEAIDILSIENDIDNRYVAYNCMLEYPRYGTKTNNGITLNDDDKKKIKIYIPKPLDNYSSLEIQKIIADFIEFHENRIQKEFDTMDKAYEATEKLKKTYLARTFNLIDWEGK